MTTIVAYKGVLAGDSRSSLGPDRRDAIIKVMPAINVVAKFTGEEKPIRVVAMAGAGPVTGLMQLSVQLDKARGGKEPVTLWDVLQPLDYQLVNPNGAYIALAEDGRSLLFQYSRNGSLFELECTVVAKDKVCAAGSGGTAVDVFNQLNPNLNAMELVGIASKVDESTGGNIFYMAAEGGNILTYSRLSPESVEELCVKVKELLSKPIVEEPAIITSTSEEGDRNVISTPEKLTPVSKRKPSKVADRKVRDTAGAE